METEQQQLDWASEKAKEVILECVEKKREQIEGVGGVTGYDVSLVEIYAEGAGKLGVGIRELARRVVVYETGAQSTTATTAATASLSSSSSTSPLMPIVTTTKVDTSSLNTLLQTASAIATPSSSGSGTASSGRNRDIQSAVDTLVHENATIITTMRSNIIKASPKPNYALMTNFVNNCREILRKLEGLDGGLGVPNFPLVVDVVDEEDLEIKKVSVGDDAKGGGTK
mmetsp:Transcript_5288/g.10564  ORF Transcript_5288/g.10564 Transcript_5288/m.10564 type:complete len:227 (+) Transcript_5288:100-780(+)